jgi:hypothetical protein
MKVYMNGYPDHWLSPYTIMDYAFFWTDWSKCHRDKGIVEDKDFIDRPEWVESYVNYLAPICEALQKVRKVINPQIRYVKIDRYDSWNADHTLSLVILPVLKQLKETKHGAPFTDDEDVPKRLRSYVATPKENEWDTDEFHFQRWDYIMDEIIWALEQHTKDDDENEFFDHSESRGVEDWNEKLGKIKVDHVGLKAHQERKQNGFRLMGKYWMHMWD